MALKWPTIWESDDDDGDDNHKLSSKIAHRHI